MGSALECATCIYLRIYVQVVRGVRPDARVRDAAGTQEKPLPHDGEGAVEWRCHMEDELHQARVTMLGVARILDAMAEGEQEMDDALRDALTVLARALEAGAPKDADR